MFLPDPPLTPLVIEIGKYRRNFWNSGWRRLAHRLAHTDVIRLGQATSVKILLDWVGRNCREKGLGSP